MIKLKSIKIKGFKEKEREINFTFSDEPVTVIYGENGCGKTTFLKILHAIFKKDFRFIEQENVKEITLIFLIDEIQEKYCRFFFDENLKYWKIEQERNNENFFKFIDNTTSILFGVHRGLVRSLNLNMDVKKGLYGIKSKLEECQILENKAYKELQNLIETLLNLKKDTNNSNRFNRLRKNDFIDSITIENIENIILDNFKKGQKIMSEQIRNAFLNTISNSIQIELATQKYELPYDFEQRIDAKRDALIDFVKRLTDLPLQKELLNYFQNNIISANMRSSKIFRALLLNILEEVENENITLKAITKLIEVFNNHLYRNKKLIVTEYETYIEVNEKERHDLDKLSSGERHLLTFLTTFLILARGYNFLLIDEPEISLNMKWQRELLPLLSELNPNSQIIVATHSPSIAHRNTNYLVELI